VLSYCRTLIYPLSLDFDIFWAVSGFVYHSLYSLDLSHDASVFSANSRILSPCFAYTHAESSFSVDLIRVFSVVFRIISCNMSQQDRPLKNNRAPRVFPDGNTGLLAILPLPATCSLSTIPPLPATRPLRATRSSYLLATTISRTKNALPDQLSSSPNHLGTSNNLSSPIVRALDRQSTLYKVHKQGNRHGAPSRKASPLAGTIIDSTTSNLGFGRQNNRRPMHPQPIGANKLPVSSQARPPVLLSRSSLNRLQSSQRPIKRKRATPTKALQQNQSQLLIQNLADIKPFEKLTALEYVLGTSLQSSEVSDDLRRLQLATKVHRNVVTSLAGPQLIRRDGLPQRSLMLQIKDLGLGQLSIAKNSECCSFCKFECNYGSSNPDILLPASASYQICTDCQPTRFFDEVLEILKQPQMSTLVSLSRKANIFPLGTQITPKYPMREYFSPHGSSCDANGQCSHQAAVWGSSDYRCQIV